MNMRMPNFVLYILLSLFINTGYANDFIQKGSVCCCNDNNTAAVDACGCKPTLINKCKGGWRYGGKGDKETDPREQCRKNKGTFIPPSDHQSGNICNVAPNSGPDPDDPGDPGEPGEDDTDPL